MTKIYTDGSCIGNPGRGGWAFVVVHEDGETCKFGDSGQATTNNEMELTAAAKALEFAASSAIAKVEIHSDSAYVVNGMTKWVSGWATNNWMTSNNKPVKNYELWRTLLDISSSVEVSWVHIKAHSGDKYNTMADMLAHGIAKGTLHDT